MPVFDVLSLVFDLLGGSAATARLGRSARRWFRKRVSESWPTAPTTVLSGRIGQSGGSYVVSAPYSFYAAGERYGGQYEREFASESKAQEALQRLLGSPPMVRFKPGDPDTSVLDDG